MLFQHFCSFYLKQIKQAEEKNSNNNSSSSEATCGCPVVHIAVKPGCWLYMGLTDLWEGGKKGQLLYKGSTVVS